MKAKKVVLVVIAVLSSVSTVLYGVSDTAEGRAYLGVSLDMQPLPELLTKHLGLSPGQGIRISNVQKDSAADKAGLDRDDIIVAFEGKPVEDNEQFTEAVREAGIGKEVTLGIIHLGKRKDVKLKLGKFKGEYDWDDWKYPPEPRAIQSWHPGRIFHLRPDEEHWKEIMLPEIKAHIKNLFKEAYCFQHSDDDEKYEIVIEGDPEDEDTLITVRFDEPDGKMSQYKVTVDEIDELPKKYREPAKDDLEKAVEESKKKKPWMYYKGSVPTPSPPDPKVWRRYFDAEKFQQPSFGPGHEAFEKQLRELKERLERLEKRQEKLLDRLSDKLDKEI